MIFLVNKHSWIFKIFLRLFCLPLKEFTRAYLFQIALEIMFLPILIYKLYLQHWHYFNNEDHDNNTDTILCYTILYYTDNNTNSTNNTTIIKLLTLIPIYTYSLLTDIHWHKWLNTWKSYMWTAVKEISMEATFAVLNTN